MILSLLITLVTAQLGQIETSGFSSLQPHERANRGQGHYLVIVWENDMRETVDVCPYGDYYDRVESDYGDGDVEVFETFTDPFVMRSGVDRDTTTTMDVVLNVRHDYDLDAEDIADLLKFKIFMVPKQWHDSYGKIDSIIQILTFIDFKVTLFAKPHKKLPTVSIKSLTMELSSTDRHVS